MLFQLHADRVSGFANSLGVEVASRLGATLTGFVESVDLSGYEAIFESTLVSDFGSGSAFLISS